jgi:FkbM family methyltransferase
LTDSAAILPKRAAKLLGSMLVYRHLLQSLFKSFGYQVSRYHPIKDPRVARQRWFSEHGVDVVLDVGANSGQYGLELRKHGFAGRIVSFEPLSSAFAQLQKSVVGQRDWTIINKAAGAANGTAEINIAGNSWSSSLLEMLPRHLESAPESRYVTKESITVTTLDDECNALQIPCDRAFLKIDAQGYTFPVLDGAEQILRKIRGVQVEMSLVSLYDGEALIEDVILRLREAGFTPLLIKPEFGDKNSGQQLQLDGIFFRL